MKEIRKGLIVGSSREWFMWFETLVVTVLSIWIWMDSDYFVGASSGVSQNGTFFWATIGPLLISIRYGFANGVICSLLVIAGIASILKITGNIAGFSFSLGVGMVMISMIAGEFRDVWHEKNQKYHQQYIHPPTAIYHCGHWYYIFVSRPYFCQHLG